MPAAPAVPQSLLMTAECDAMHGALMRRADALEGCAEGSDEEAELRAIVDAIEAYESGPLANWQGAGRERVGGRPGREDAPRGPNQRMGPRKPYLAVLATHSCQRGGEIRTVYAGTEGEIDGAFASLAQARTGALLVPDDIFFNGRLDQLVALAARYAIPTVYGVRESPLAGGLMSYGFNLAQVYQVASLQVARIIQGEKPADLPVIQLSKIELVINLKTAKGLGLTVPATLLARSDEVIE